MSRDAQNGIRAKGAFIIDMDGVLYHGNRLLDGAREFVEWLQAQEKRFLFLTNSSERTLKERQQKLSRLGIEADESHFYTSALATAAFPASQHPGRSAYVIGEAGLTNALHDAGISMNDTNPDYVVLGDTRSYSFEKLEKAVNLVRQGARLIGANPDLTGPIETGSAPPPAGWSRRSNSRQAARPTLSANRIR